MLRSQTIQQKKKTEQTQESIFLTEISTFFIKTPKNTIECCEAESLWFVQMEEEVDGLLVQQIARVFVKFYN